MYLQHFGLAQYPFSLTPNTRYFLKLPSHERAFSTVMAALADSRHFARITGEPGTGKTLLCRKVMNSLEAHPRAYATAYLPHPVLTEEGLMQNLAEELSLSIEPGLTYYDLLKKLSARLIQLADTGLTTVFFIDEAQAMPEETLQAVSLLAQLDSPRHKHLQVVLFGQPELNRLLERPGLRPLRQDLSFSCELPELDQEGVTAYVAHRLSKAGYNGPPMFSDKALERLYRGSGGVPRLLNILCHKALMVAYGKGEEVITEHHLARALADTRSAQSPRPQARRLLAG